MSIEEHRLVSIFALAMQGVRDGIAANQQIIFSTADGTLKASGEVSGKWFVVITNAPSLMDVVKRNFVEAQQSWLKDGDTAQGILEIEESAP